MDSYANVMRGVRPGDASSPLVRTTQSRGSMYRYWSGSSRAAKADMVLRWVVTSWAAQTRPGALALAGLLVFLATANRADDTLSVQFHTSASSSPFQDTRGVTALSPTVDLDKDFTERTGLRARFGVDSISAASDSCARCHPEGANNQRIYLSGAVRRKLGDTRLEIGGELSKERFYQASTLAGSISRTLDKGNTTVAGGFSFSWNRPQLHPCEETMSQLAPSAYVAVSHAVSKSTAVQLGYQFDYVSGYQNSPFLRTILNGSRPPLASSSVAWSRTCPRSLMAGESKETAKTAEESAIVVSAPPPPTKIPSLPSRRMP
jgi:Protein of unknown function (DUF3570)